jgi:hypothetical protein
MTLATLAAGSLRREFWLRVRRSKVLRACDPERLVLDVNAAERRRRRGEFSARNRILEDQVETLARLECERAERMHVRSDGAGASTNRVEPDARSGIASLDSSYTEIEVTAVLGTKTDYDAPWPLPSELDCARNRLVGRPPHPHGDEEGDERRREESKHRAGMPTKTAT